jgi:endoglucanase
MKELMALVLVTAAGMAMAADRTLPDASWSHLPRWRGFNLLEKFNVGKNEPFREEDFRLIAALGFNFVRLPMDYRCWIVDGDWRRLSERSLKEIDQAIEYGKRHGIHVNLNFHRAPGYTVASPPEAKSLWTDPEAQEVCAMHWGAFARRYKGVPNRHLSFNLLNEPAGIGPAVHAAVIVKLVTAIRAEDPDRLIICDSRQWGTVPSDELVPLRVAQATRGYVPMEVTHYKAPWVGMDDSVRPSWPILDASGRVPGPSGREWLAEKCVAPFRALEAKGVGVMVGEFGAFNKTPHPVVLGWMSDCLANWKDAGWGWALWNFRGSFGVLDSDRSDVVYEDFHGHKLDRKMLELLQAN